MFHDVICLTFVVLRSDQTITPNLCERAVLCWRGIEQNPCRLVDPVGAREFPPVVPTEQLVL
jgi:site-specific recombinase